MTVLILTGFCFLAAYGSAMGKAVYRRQTAIAAGNEATVPTKTYQWTGRILLAAGLAGIAATATSILVR